MNDNRESVRLALRAWGSAIRGDWGSIDGRSCRDQLEDLSNLLKPDAPATRFEDACRIANVCWSSKSWPEYCPDAQGYDCPHMQRDSYLDAESEGGSGTVDPPRAASELDDVYHDLRIVMRARLRALGLHHPMRVEVEKWHDEGVDYGLPGDCPDGECNGHIVTLTVCDECGYDEGDGTVHYHLWPCPTTRALDLDPESGAGGSVVPAEPPFVRNLRTQPHVEVEPAPVVERADVPAEPPRAECRKVRPDSGNSHAPWWCSTHDSPIAVIATRCAAAFNADRARAEPPEPERKVLDLMQALEDSFTKAKSDRAEPPEDAK